MGRRKIDLVVLAEKLRDGWSNKQCAKFFQVSVPAISQARKRLKIATTKNVVMESANTVVVKELNILEQMQKINGCTHQLLDHLMSSFANLKLTP
jgi:hypothetical protein